MVTVCSTASLCRSNVPTSSNPAPMVRITGELEPAASRAEWSGPSSGAAGVAAPSAVAVMASLELVRCFLPPNIRLLRPPFEASPLELPLDGGPSSGLDLALAVLDRDRGA